MPEIDKPAEDDPSTDSLRHARGLSSGYLATEVDAFLDQLREALAHEPPTMAPYEVADARFKARRVSRRYSMRSVDDHLTSVQDELRERHGEDAVAGIDGHTSPPRHFPTLWIYLIALVLIGMIVAFAFTQL